MTGRSSDAALLVFAKAPVPGHVKTRLTSVLSGAEAAGVYEAFLLDSLDVYASLPVDVHLWVGGDVAAMPEAVREGAESGVYAVHAQQGADLGARMLSAFVDAFMSGYERAVVIGTDHPTLPSAFIGCAFEELEAPMRFVLGPSDDGGFYLMGMNDLHPGLFNGMTYSHGAVFDQTLERAHALPGSVTILPPWYDVDTPEALRRLVRDLEESPDAVVPARRTRAVLARLSEAHDLT